ncbi:MAG: DUF1573 domain-containing protein [Planctomycetota bacterium]|nr:MAG: DUF1573 domain-containing protein [Planctomycetota bacterium]
MGKWREQIVADCKPHSPVSSQWGVIVAVLILSTTALFFVSKHFWAPVSADQAAETNSDAVRLVVYPSDLDLGEFYYRDSISRRLVIHNKSDRDVVISSFQMSCSCTSVTPRELLVPAQGTAVIHVGIDLRHADPRVAFLADRLVSTTINPVVDMADPIRMPSWRLSGTCKSLASISKGSLSFTDVIRGSVSNSQPITVIPYQSDTTVEADCPPENASVRLSQTSSGYSLVVTPNSDRDAGVHKFAITIRIRAASPNSNIPARSAVSIPVVMSILDDVQTDPRAILLGKLGPHEDRHELLSVFSASGKPVVIESVESDDPFVSLQILPLESVRCQIRVSVRPGDQPVGQPCRITINGQSDGVQFVRSVKCFYHVVQRKSS